MELSLFLAKLFGLYMLIIAAMGFFRQDQFKLTVRHIMSSEGVVALAGIINLILGLAILIGHPIWELNWRGLITLLGVFSIIKGIMRLAFPQQEQKIVSAMIGQGYWIVMVIVAILGAYLAYNGFLPAFS